MRMTIESTSTVEDLDGSRCRLWLGTTESGIQARVFVYRVTVPDDQDVTEAERKLVEQAPTPKTWREKMAVRFLPSKTVEENRLNGLHPWTKWDAYSAFIAPDLNRRQVERIKATTEALNALTQAATRSADLDEQDDLAEHISHVAAVLAELVSREDAPREATAPVDGKGGQPLTAEAFRQLGFTLRDNGCWRMALLDEQVGSSTWWNFLQLVDHGVEGEWYAEIHSTSRDDTTGEATESSVCLPRVFRTRGDVRVLLIACGVTR